MMGLCTGILAGAGLPAVQITSPNSLTVPEPVPEPVGEPVPERSRRRVEPESKAGEGGG